MENRMEEATQNLMTAFFALAESAKGKILIQDMACLDEGGKPRHFSMGRGLGGTGVCPPPRGYGGGDKGAEELGIEVKTLTIQNQYHGSEASLTVELDDSDKLVLFGYDTRLQYNGQWDILPAGNTDAPWDTITAIRAYIDYPHGWDGQRDLQPVMQILSLTPEITPWRSTVLIRSGRRHPRTWAYAIIGTPTWAKNILTIPIKRVLETNGFKVSRHAHYTNGLHISYCAASDPDSCVVR